MKVNKLIILACVLGSIVLSCDKEEISTVHYRAYFLGNNSFQLSGEIFGPRGQVLTEDIGNHIIAKIYHLDSDWEIKAPINGNKFDFTISKTGDEGFILSKDLSSGSGHLMWDAFIAYFNNLSIPYDDTRGRVKIFSLIFENNGYFLQEFVSTGDIFVEYFSYVYVTEPANLTGNFIVRESGFNDAYWYYDLDFSQPGWYKIINSYNKPIGNNPIYSSSENIKLRRYRDLFD